MRRWLTAALLDWAYMGEVLFGRLQGIGWDNQRWNGEHALLRILRPRVVVDVGAFRGDWTDAALRYGAHRVICVEPDPDNASHLKDRFAVDPVTIHRCALCDRTGTIGFTPSDNLTHAGHVSEGPLEVPMMTLDVLDLPPVDLLKIDVEGAEMAVLRGGEALFASGRVRVAQVEYTVHWQRFGARLEDLCAFARRHRYVVGVLTPFGPAHLVYGVGVEDYRYRNILLMRSDALAALRPIRPAGRARVEIHHTG